MESVAIIGAGTMGTGIAQVAALAGWGVRLIEPDDEALSRAVSAIQTFLDRQVEKGILDAGRRKTVAEAIQSSSAIGPMPDVGLAVEAVVEDLAVKRSVFHSLEAALGPGAVLATNTSSLSVTRIAEAVRAPACVVGMHFFNPAPLMPLVEIIAARQSGAEFIARAEQIARTWGKVTVRAKDTPGFIVNRVARGFYLEALRLLDEGVAGIDEIDAIMRTHAGFRMGPFQLMDLVGLDVNLAVSTSVWEQLGKPARLAPHPIQKALVAQGHLGRKTKRGFYSYDDLHPLPTYAVNRRTFELSPLLSDALRAFTQRATAALGQNRGCQPLTRHQGVDLGCPAPAAEPPSRVKGQPADGATVSPSSRSAVQPELRPSGSGLNFAASATEQLIVGRILGAVLNEAAFAFGEGVATAADIDTALVKGTNYPLGPIEWADRIGHRTVLGVLTALNRTVPDNRYASAELFAG
jgi:3-hydroxybutyryl-CoA dehydrogenase